MCQLTGARSLLDHTRAAAAGCRLGTMIKIDQLILAAVAGLTVIHLIGAGWAA